MLYEPGQTPSPEEEPPFLPNSKRKKKKRFLCVLNHVENRLRYVSNQLLWRSITNEIFRVIVPFRQAPRHSLILFRFNWNLVLNSSLLIG